MNTTYIIPTSNFKRLIENDFSDKFQFIIREANINNFQKDENLKKIKIITTTNKARIVSRKINEIYQIDPTINKFHISLLNEDPSDIKQIIELLVRCNGEEIEIPIEKENLFSKILYIFGENDGGTVFEIKNQDEAISLLNTNFHDNSICYLSNNFIDLITSGQAKNLSQIILFEIIDNYFCTRQNNINQKEITKIFKLMQREEPESQIIIHFLIQIPIESFDDEMINYFYSHLDDKCVQNDISQVIYILKKHLLLLTSMSKRKSKFAITKKPPERNKITECQYKDNELSGIINHLEKEYGKDLKKKGILTITGGGYHNSSCPITNLIKYDKDNINDFYYNYSSQNPKSENDSWIEFDFGHRKVNLSSYTIRACCHEISNECKAKSWRIVGSNDHENWDVLDHEINRSEIKEKYSLHRFVCEKSSKYYRYIRYIQEETWHTNEECKYHLHFSCFEFFGSIMEDNSPYIMQIKLANQSYS